MTAIRRATACLIIPLAVAAGCRTSAFRDERTAVVRVSPSGVISVAGKRTTVAGLPGALRSAGVTGDSRIEVICEGRLSAGLRDGIANGLVRARLMKFSFISSRRVDSAVR